MYFEEWDNPMISGIAWISELIEVAGGVDIFGDCASGKSAPNRIGCSINSAPLAHSSSGSFSTACLARSRICSLSSNGSTPPAAIFARSPKRSTRPAPLAA